MSDDDRQCSFKVTFWVSGPRWKLKDVKFEVAAYCESKDLEVKTVENIGLICGKVFFTVKGRGTYRFAKRVKAELDRWCDEICED